MTIIVERNVWLTYKRAHYVTYIEKRPPTPLPVYNNHRLDKLTELDRTNQNCEPKRQR